MALRGRKSGHTEFGQPMTQSTAAPMSSAARKRLGRAASEYDARRPQVVQPDIVCSRCHRTYSRPGLLEDGLCRNRRQCDIELREYLQMMEGKN